MGNLGSIQNMLRKVGCNSIITDNVEKISKAEKIILPGVGSFDRAMKNLNAMNIISVLNKKILEEHIPVLGICLGMQLLAKKSDEGAVPGLGYLDAEVKKFIFEDSIKLRIPHMGWNTIEIEKLHLLLDELDNNSRFYFVHSYHIVCQNRKDVLASTDHGYKFTSAVAKGNILGVQFHPEKSHKFGMKLLKNFAKL